MNRIKFHLRMRDRVMVFHDSAIVLSNALGIIIKPLMTQINRQTPVGEAIASTEGILFSRQVRLAGKVNHAKSRSSESMGVDRWSTDWNKSIDSSTERGVKEN